MFKPLLLSVALAGLTVHGAQAFSFTIGGSNVDVSVRKHCYQLSCLSLAVAKERRVHDQVRMPIRRPAGVAVAPRKELPTVPAEPRAVQAVPAPQAVSPTRSVPTVAAPKPIHTAAVAPVSAPSPVAKVQPVAAPVAQPVATPTAAQAMTSPVGVWLTEKNEGQIHIVDCGGELCGYAYKQGRDGERVLIDMRSADGQTWQGKIVDTRGYGTYSSTIVMQGSDALRVQGCAFGGMVCGGQTWSRVAG